MSKDSCFRQRCRRLFFLTFCGLLLLTAARSQTLNNDLNLDFERLDSAFFPSGWTHTKISADAPGRKAIIGIDSTIRYHGKYSLHINLPENYNSIFTSKRIIKLPETGHKVTLRGYIRTEHVEGFAGLWLRIDGDNGPIALENMMRQRINGSNEWKEYNISLDYDPKSARGAALGGIIGTHGKLWIDDLHVYIDDVEIVESAPPVFQKEPLLAGPKPSLNERQTNDFARLGSLWGFLKYHHSHFTSGKYDADKEFLKMAERVYNSKSGKETDHLLEQWLDSLGIPEAGKQVGMSVADTLNSKCTPAYNILFDKRYFTKGVVKRSKQILENMDCSAGQFYVTRDGLVTGFERENSYYQVSNPDWPLRLLALFRFWNAIEYFFPYRHLISDWDSVLFRYVDVFFNASTGYDYLLACQQLICEIEDSHARVFPTIFQLQGKTNMAPLKISYIQHKPVIDELYPASADDSMLSAVHRGDIVTRINDVEIDSLIKKCLPITSGSNPETKFRDVFGEYLLKTKESRLSLTLQNGSHTKTVSISTISQSEYSKRLLDFLENSKTAVIEDSICYIPAIDFDLLQVKELLDDVHCQIKRVILDMRSPTMRQGTNDSLVLFTGMFANSPVPYCAFSSANFCHPGYFPILNSNLIRVTAPGNVPKCPLKLFILVDENVQSDDECFTMALQCVPGSLTVGTRTAGTDGNITSLTLPGNVTTWFTSLGAYYPDGTETQKVGIKIDKIVERTIEGMRQGKDELVEAASHL